MCFNYTQVALAPQRASAEVKRPTFFIPLSIRIPGIPGKRPVCYKLGNDIWLKRLMNYRYHRSRNNCQFIDLIVQVAPSRRSAPHCGN